MRQFIKNKAQKLKYFVPSQYLQSLQNKYLLNPVIRKYSLEHNKTNLFKAIFIELRSKCNSTCTFCPVSIGNDIRDDITMDYELYKNIINQLVDLKFPGRIAFFNNSEPLITKDLFKYLKYATTNLNNDNIFHVCTNGIALSNKIGELLIESGINRITINVYTDDLTKSLPEKILNFQEKVIKYNEKHNYIKLSIQKRYIKQVLCNKSGDAPNKPEATSMEFRNFCLQVFTRLVIDPNGIIGLCCMDAFMKKTFGNIRQSPIIDIWNCSELQHYRNELLEGNRNELEVCKDCDYQD